MLPTVALVGRPNVGKSTLFNRLTRTRDALVADVPGLTRDRHYGRGRARRARRTSSSTPAASSRWRRTASCTQMARQTRQAIAEADVVLFIVDARDGLTPQDRDIATLLRKAARPVVLVVNKAEGLPRGARGGRVPRARRSASRCRSRPRTARACATSLEVALAHVPPPRAPNERLAADDDDKRVKVAIVGRPNVGKSTLVNALLGEERVIAFDEPGTTRDAIYLDFERDGRRYTLIDTAGVRRRGKVFEAVEKFSVIKTLQAIEDANVVVLLLDAAARDHRAGRAPRRRTSSRRAARWCVGVNKWDAVDADAARRRSSATSSASSRSSPSPRALHLGARGPRASAR